MLVLSDLGVPIAPILTVRHPRPRRRLRGPDARQGRDHGFFILLENQFRVGDVIQTAGVSGAVEAINLRTTVLRTRGRVHVIPNGSIAVVTNFTHGYSRPWWTSAWPTARTPIAWRRSWSGSARTWRPTRVGGPARGKFQVRGSRASRLLRRRARHGGHEAAGALERARELRRRIKKRSTRKGSRSLPAADAPHAGRGADRSGTGRSRE